MSKSMPDLFSPAGRALAGACVFGNRVWELIEEADGDEITLGRP